MANPFSTKMWDRSSSRFLFNQQAIYQPEGGIEGRPVGMPEGTCGPVGQSPQIMVTMNSKKITEM